MEATNHRFLISPARHKIGSTVGFWVSDIQFHRGKIVEYYETTRQYSVATNNTHKLVDADDIWLVQG